MSLYNRGASWYEVVNVPKNLRHIIKKRQIWVSLHTSEKTIAKIRSAMILSKINQQFIIERQKMAVFNDGDTPRLKVFYEYLATPDGYLEYKDVDIESCALDFCIDKTNKDLAVINRDIQTLNYYQFLLNDYISAYKANDYTMAKDAVDAYIIANKMPKPTENCCPKFLKAFMLAYIQHIEMAINYLKGAELNRPNKIISALPSIETQTTSYYTPATTQSMQPYRKPDLNLAELGEIYNNEGSRDNVSQAQKDKINHRLYVLNQLLQGKTIRLITPDDLQRLVYDVQWIPLRLGKNNKDVDMIAAVKKNREHPEKSISPKTRGDYLQTLKSIYVWALKRKYINENIMEQIDVPAIQISKTEEKYIPFTVQQMNVLFHSDLFSQHWDNNPQKRSMFWITLLGAFTGARLNEICQLEFDDVLEDEGVYYISINENNGKHVKTKAGIRRVPLHNELLRIGFLEFVAKMKKIAPKNKDNKRIFFTLKPNTRGEYSAQPSKWFGKMLDDLGLKQKGLCFHSWRHTARTILRNNNCLIDRVQLIQGWEGANSLSEHYGTISIKVLADELNDKLRYDGLDLSHLYINK